MLMSMNEWEIKHTVQLRAKHDDGTYGPWFNDDEFYTGWFHYNPTWSDKPTDKLVDWLEEKKRKRPNMEFRIVIEKKCFSRRFV